MLSLAHVLGAIQILSFYRNLALFYLDRGAPVATLGNPDDSLPKTPVVFLTLCEVAICTMELAEQRIQESNATIQPSYLHQIMMQTFYNLFERI